MSRWRGAEQASLLALREAGERESGYSAEQSTKPQTLGYGLVDSPARGGHFAALEQPGLFTGEVRSFFRPVR